MTPARTANGVDRQSSGPAYGQLAGLLRTQIRNNQYPGGRALPTEAELSVQHHISRQTVRRAFQDLVAEGLVYRVPGRGTFTYNDEGKYLRSSGTIEELMALSIDTELDVVVPPCVKVDIEAAGRLHLDSDRVVSMRFRRLHADQPYCVTTAFLPTHIGQGLLDIPEFAEVGVRRKMTVLSVVQRLAGRPIAGADQTITAVGAPAELCGELECELGEAVLRIDRIYFDRDRQLLELAINHFHPARYTYRFQMKATRQ